MELFSIDELKTLTQKRKGPCVSMFLPTHRAGPQIRQDPIRLKNLLSSTEEKLVAYGLRAPEARDLIAPAEHLLADGNFWRHQSDGLAVFIAPDMFRLYRVPITFGDLTNVASRFYVKPLLSLLIDGRFFLLTLSINRIRLFQASRFGIVEVNLVNVPRSLLAALGRETTEQHLQFHTRTSGATLRPAMFFGQGGREDDVKNELLRFFQKVDRGLNALLNGENAPLLLAGVEYELPIYREANTYKNLISEGIQINPEELSMEELHRRAWAIVKPLLLTGEAEAEARFDEYQGTGRASADLRHIVPATYHGLVETLFVATGVQKKGSFNPDTGAVTESRQETNGGEDLLNFAAVHTLLNRGVVFTVPPERVPGGGSCAAVFRYEQQSLKSRVA